MVGCSVYLCDESSVKTGRDSETSLVQSPTGLELQDQIANKFRKSHSFEAPLCEAPFLKYYIIPDGEIGLQWKVAGGRQLAAYPVGAFMCSKHFAKEQYKVELLEKRHYRMQGIRILRDNAVPTLQLPKKRPRTENQNSRQIRLEARTR